MGRKSSGHTTGVELRFRLKGDHANIRLRMLPDVEAQVAYIFFGSIQGGYQNSSCVIGTQPTKITIKRPENADMLRCISRDAQHPFSPELVRVILPYGTCIFLGLDGDIEPPHLTDVPTTTYLAYGSSITHGSLALAAPYTYPFRIAQKIGCDYLNFGFAGSAHMEKEIAEYIISRKDWDFASVEMGINMIKDTFSIETFDERVDTFTSILAKDSRPIFATSIFGFNGDQQEKGMVFRDIVRKYAESRLRFTDGLDLLNNPAFITQDLTHPSLEGIAQIADRWWPCGARRLIRCRESDGYFELHGRGGDNRARKRRAHWRNCRQRVLCQ